MSRTSKYPPHRVGLPDAILLDRNEALVEIASNLPERQPAGPILSHHSDRGLLVAVLHELVVQVVGAERQRPDPLPPVSSGRLPHEVCSCQNRVVNGRTRLLKLN